MEKKIMVRKVMVKDEKKLVKELVFGFPVEKMTWLKTEESVKRRIREKALSFGVFQENEMKELKFDWKEYFKSWREEREKLLEKEENEESADSSGVLKQAA